MDISNLESIGLRKIVKNGIEPYVTLTVEGDCNDADYETATTTYKINDDKDFKKLSDTVRFIKENENDLWCEHSLLDTDIADKILDGDYFDIPHDSDGLCHTITDMSFTYTDENGTTFDLEII